MKLTKERLVQIIKEEMEMAETFVEEEEKIKSDVVRIQKLLPFIDNKAEYEQFLNMAIQFVPKGLSPTIRSRALFLLRQEITNLIKDLSSAQEPKQPGSKTQMPLDFAPPPDAQ